jgi:DNA-binding MarR family transcriptional regulator
MTTLSDLPVILGVLQNPWFHKNTDQGLIDRYNEDADFRRHVLARTYTGKRLIRTLGGDLYRHIWWDNANYRHVPTPSGKNPADLNHLRRVLDRVNPYLIVAFGAEAHKIMAITDRMIKCVPHPNARFVKDDFYIQLRKDIEEICWAWKQEKLNSLLVLQAQGKLPDS